MWYWIFKFMMKHSVKLTGSIEGPAYHRAWTNHNFKGTVSQIFKCPYMQTWQYPIYTGTQPLIAFLAGQVWIRYQCFCFLKLFILICGFSAYLFLIRLRFQGYCCKWCMPYWNSPTEHFPQSWHIIAYVVDFSYLILANFLK